MYYAADRLALLQYLDWSTSERMDRARVALTRQIAARLRGRAVAPGEFIPRDIEDETLAFVNEAVGCGRISRRRRVPAAVASGASGVAIASSTSI